MMTFLDLAKNGGLLFDGAMGTMLYQRGIFLNRCFEAVNLEQPELVSRVHQEYLQAGAQVITANTFGSGRLKLEKQGLSDKFEDINRRGVELARAAVDGRAYVAGSVGPSGIVGLSGLAGEEGLRAEESLREHIALLVDAGVDLLCLETFAVVSELEMAIRISKEYCDLPVVALCMFTEGGSTRRGLTPEAVGRRLIDAGADVIGANCGGGPDHLFGVTTRMVDLGHPVVAMANAGNPKTVENRTIYVANPEYFGVFARRLFKAGVKVVGGCCGTTPEHVRRMANSARMLRATNGVLDAEYIDSATEYSGHSTPLADRSDLGACLDRNEFVTSVELNPPNGLDLSSRIEAARALKDFGITTINIADGPRASLRMGNVAMAVEVAQKTSLSPLVHVCCRDRNYLGLQSHLLGMHVLGIRNIVVITGDPPKMGPFPHATGVYDVNSIGLLNLIQGFNHGLDASGQTLPDRTSFVCATGAEPAAHDYDRELRRLEMKISAGASVIMTQPVYDPAVIERFLNDIKEFNVPVMLGLCPLASYRNAVFLNKNVPGMSVPDDVLARMKVAEDKGQGQAEGVAIARDALDASRTRIQGAYIMPPFGRYKVAMAVLDGFLDP
ncbi:MAG: bifunctional homocysteine S-methyltransferase/methylenetetrahydrofolate reductase [Myxococcales bacterium]|nr:bifunctional homocysteine S-methyltransferase/methylenetetrahydrofolate reductase [Myxococcales bacterium]|tara:strand:+ start:1066 stop:2904 length:1839 start_codon:yes stop_codon:yes gene_type:complete